MRKKLKSFSVIFIALTLVSGCGLNYSSRQERPLPVNLKQKCSIDMPDLAGPTGGDLASLNDWYQEEYTVCAGNHNGLIDALKERGIE